MNSYPRIILAGTQSGVGKTTLTMGLHLALKKKGISVQPYKIGPDYIDSGFHTGISGIPCRNLDSFLLTKDVILELFERQSQKVSFSLIEGVMGLFDGAEADSDIGSTAHIAKILKCPVILIIDVGRMAGSAGAAASGYEKFDRKLNIAGFILNRIGSPSHYQVTRSAIEKKTKLPVLGYLPKSESLVLEERHLGLVPVKEAGIRNFCKKLGNLTEKHIDTKRIVEIAKSAPPLPDFKKSIFDREAVSPAVTIAVAYDKAFHFYYEDNLDILKHYGAKLVQFSPLKAKSIPSSANGIYIGGGFPEIFASGLAGNKILKKDIKARSENGMPIYAECGGLMYLMEKIVDFEGREFPMAGIFPGIVRMDKKLRMLGYHTVKSISNNILCKKGAKTKGHVFHWSYLEKIPKDTNFAFEIQRRAGKYPDGFLTRNTLASYVHIHFGTSPSWAQHFVSSCLQYKKRKERE